MMELLKVFLVFCMACLGSSKRLTQMENTITFVSVMDYGAVGDGLTDDTQAFLKAWEAICKGAPRNPSELHVTMGHRFLLKPLTFEGPCKYPFSFKIFGTLVAPSDPDTWDIHEKNNWIIFSKVTGLTLSGYKTFGAIDGQGLAWWKLAETKGEEYPRPTALQFENCDNLRLQGLRHYNSARNHIKIYGCNGVTISDLQISAPETSPNTDGIDIGQSSNVQIHDSYIGTGDDCIAIGGGSSFINITGITCGPGHGISIGSLGADNRRDEVEEIHVRNCNFSGTTNGARIKTWQGGSGFARKISFEDINLDAVANPIFINQYYCMHDTPCENQTSAVQISDITYEGVQGTSTTGEAINLKCSESVACTNIMLSNINIISASPSTVTRASCANAHGSSSATFPVVDCLSKYPSLLILEIRLVKRNKGQLLWSYSGSPAHSPPLFPIFVLFFAFIFALIR